MKLKKVEVSWVLSKSLLPAHNTKTPPFYNLQLPPSFLEHNAMRNIIGDISNVNGIKIILPSQFSLFHKSL